MKRAFFALAAMASSALAVDVPFTYTGSFSAAAHPSIEGAVVATFTPGGTLSVTNLCKTTRILAVGGGGIGGGGGDGDGGCRRGTAQAQFTRQNAPGIPGGDGRGGGGGGSSNGSLDAARGGRGFLALRYHPNQPGPVILLH